VTVLLLSVLSQKWRPRQLIAGSAICHLYNHSWQRMCSVYFSTQTNRGPRVHSPWGVVWPPVRHTFIGRPREKCPPVQQNWTTRTGYDLEDRNKTDTCICSFLLTRQSVFHNLMLSQVSHFAVFDGKRGERWRILTT